MSVPDLTVVECAADEAADARMRETGRERDRLDDQPICPTCGGSKVVVYRDGSTGCRESSASDIKVVRVRADGWDPAAYGVGEFVFDDEFWVYEASSLRGGETG